MIQGTASHVGKSLITAGLCRLLQRIGVRVAPFKPQNMSNNAAVTDDGGEIGRAQALQAYASVISTSVHLNPVLLKPEPHHKCQIILQGRWWKTVSAQQFHHLKHQLMPKILESYYYLQTKYQFIITEGAGSPAEINLRRNDIANMGFAEVVDIPVVLVVDVERGGSIANVFGTHGLLSPSERQRIKGVIINKFRGDVHLFDGAIQIIQEKTTWPVLGVIPYFPLLQNLPAEDSLSMPSIKNQGKIRIAVPLLPYRSNMDDLDPLNAEDDVELLTVKAGEAIPGNCHAVILTGSKSTIADLEFLKQQGWDIDLKAHYRRGGYIIGLCGGFQMLGNNLVDATGLEGQQKQALGLGYFDMTTTMNAQKIIRQQRATELLDNMIVDGYEIHLGQSIGPATSRPWLRFEDGQFDGAVTADNRVLGCYVHGLFMNDQFRHAFLRRILNNFSSSLNFSYKMDHILNDWAEHLRANLNPKFIQSLLSLTKSVVPS
jgi:adenosylcobyric acid synthase